MSTPDLDDVTARLVVLETFCMTTLGLYLANARNDANYEKAKALLAHLSDVPSQVDLPPAQKAKATAYAQQLAETLAANLSALRGEDGPAH